MAERFGRGRLPWVIQVYLVLLFVFTLLAVAAARPVGSADLQSLASDGLKTVLAALLGALSHAGERQFRSSLPKSRTGGRPCE